MTGQPGEMEDCAPSHEEMVERLQEARKLLQGVAHRTPVHTSRTLDELSGATVFLKCENFQRIGAFKFRGAYTAISRLPEQARSKGVVAFSSGNHAQAVALVSRLLAMRAVIVMPSTAPVSKLEATRGYGAEIFHHDRHGETREAAAERLAGERGLTLIPPFNHPDIVAGQGTAAYELIEEVGDLDAIVAPLGGGGLLSGTSLAARHLSPGCKVIGVEPEGGDDGARSFRSGRLEVLEKVETIADGARTPSLGPITLSLIRRYAHDVLTVPDRHLVETMHFVWTRMKMVVEPTGVLGLAALFKGTLDLGGKRVGVIVSGGNVDLDRAAELFRGLGASRP